MKNALLIIDVQQTLCEGRWAAHDIQAVIARINGLSARARAAGAPVLLIQHEEDEGPMQHGSPGWQLAPGLSQADSDLRLRKRSPDSFHHTPLLGLLQERGIDSLTVCGLQTDYCVDTTVRRALALGFPVRLAGDAHSTLDNAVLSAPQIIAHHNLTLAQLDSFGPRVTVTPAEQLDFGAA